MSITFSLIAVFIPLFLMSGYVGLLFREFAITVSVSLALSLVIRGRSTPMMCAYLLSGEQGARMALSVLERGFDSLLNLYERASSLCCGTAFITLMVMFRTIGTTGYSTSSSKGFFPQQDTD